MTPTISVGAFDDNPIILDGIKNYFNGQGDYHLVFVCQKPSELSELVQRHEPDLLIMDVIVDGVFGLEKFQEIRDHFPDVLMVSFSNVSSMTILENLYAVGSKAFVSKREELDRLKEAIDYVVETGKPWIPEELKSLIGEVEAPILLTRREKAVLKHIIEGLPTKQIADVESISIHTVDFHRRNLFKKFGIANVAELVREGVEFGYNE